MYFDHKKGVPQGRHEISPALQRREQTRAKRYRAAEGAVTLRRKQPRQRPALN
jgi:hypothetical protein